MKGGDAYDLIRQRKERAAFREEQGPKKIIAERRKEEKRMNRFFMTRPDVFNADRRFPPCGTP